MRGRYWLWWKVDDRDGARKMTRRTSTKSQLLQMRRGLTSLPRPASGRMTRYEHFKAQPELLQAAQPAAQ